MGCSVLVDLDGLGAGGAPGPGTGGHGGGTTTATTTTGNGAGGAGVGGAGGGAAGAGGIGGAGVGGAGGLVPELLDDFNRVNNDALGNGWTEKSPQALAIIGQAAVKLATPALGYRDVMAYRPEAEDQLDAEVSIEFTVLTAQPGFPQVFLRAQRATIDVADQYDGYLLFIAGEPATAVLARQHGNQSTTDLVEFPLSPPLDTNSVYRLRLRAIGTGVVGLQGFVEEQVGASWVAIGEATYADSSVDRIAAAGAVGFGAHTEASPIYDNFRWRALSP